MLARIGLPTRQTRPQPRPSGKTELRSLRTIGGVWQQNPSSARASRLSTLDPLHPRPQEPRDCQNHRGQGQQPQHLEEHLCFAVMFVGSNRMAMFEGSRRARRVRRRLGRFRFHGCKRDETGIMSPKMRKANRYSPLPSTRFPTPPPLSAAACNWKSPQRKNCQNKKYWEEGGGGGEDNGG